MTIIVAKHKRHKRFFKQTTIWRLSLLNALRHFLVNDNIFHRTSTHAVYLPYSYNSIGDEDEEDNERFNKGCDCPLPFFKPSQGLQDKETGERSMLLSLLSFVCIRSRVNLMLYKYTVHTNTLTNDWSLVYVSVCILLVVVHTVVLPYKWDACSQQQDSNQQILKLFQDQLP